MATEPKRSSGPIASRDDGAIFLTAAKTNKGSVRVDLANDDARGVLPRTDLEAHLERLLTRGRELAGTLIRPEVDTLGMGIVAGTEAHRRHILTICASGVPPHRVQSDGQTERVCAVHASLISIRRATNTIRPGEQGHTRALVPTPARARTTTTVLCWDSRKAYTSVLNLFSFRISGFQFPLGHTDVTDTTTPADGTRRIAVFLSLW